MASTGKTCGHLKEIVKSLKKLKQAEDEDHIYYAKRKRDSAAVSIVGGAVSVLGFLGMALIPVTGGVSAVLSSAAIVAGGSGTALSTVGGVAGIYAHIAENSALSLTVDLAQRDLKDFADYLSMVSKTNLIYKGMESNSLAILGPLIQLSSLAILTANGMRLAGDTAFQYLKQLTTLAGTQGVTLISIGFNVRDFTQNNKIIKLGAQSDLSRELEKIICGLEAQIQTKQGS